MFVVVDSGTISSVKSDFALGGVRPPKDIDDACVPAFEVAVPSMAVDLLAADLQLVPSYFTHADVFPARLLPVIPKAAVCIPDPPICSIALAKAPPVVQEEPSYSSVALVKGPASPPKASPAVCVPHPLKISLPVFKAPPPVVPLFVFQLLLVLF